MPVRIVTTCCRVLCALVGLAIVGGTIAGIGSVLGPATTAFVRRYGLVALLVAIVCAVVLAHRGWAPGRLLTRIPKAYFLAASLAVALASGIWAHFAIQKGVPDIPDEFGYLHQARGFADGFLAPPSPPLSEFHYVSWGIHDHGRWYAVFPPGYGLALSAGVKAGVPWMVNPILGALLVLVIFALGADLFGGDGLAPRVAVLVYLASWFRLMHAGSFMSHPLAALFTALAVLGALRGVIMGDSLRWGLIGGAALAGLAATRPLNAAIVAVVLLPPVAYVALSRRGTLHRVLPPLAAMVPILLAYGLYNRALTGSALLPPQQRYMELKEQRKDCFRLGFGPGVGECPITQSTHFGKDGFQPRHALANTGRRLDAYLRDGFAFPVLVLLPAAALLLAAGGVDARLRALPAWLLLATLVGYGLFFYHGVAYGPRFFYETFAFVVLLAGAAVADADRRLARRPLVRAAAGGALVALLVAGMTASWPSIAKASRRARTQDGKALAVLDRPELRDAVVFVDSMVIPAAMTLHPGRLDRNHPLVVKDNGDAANAGYLRLHPGRAPFRMVGLKVTPLTYPEAVPIRHEGGALYPLEIAEGGFGDRAPSEQAFKLPLSARAALRFRADRAGARFAFPSWTPREDAGRLVTRWAIVAHPGSPTIQVLLDGQPISDWLETRSPRPALTTLDIPAQVTEGSHWLEVRMRERGTLLIDHVELRQDGLP